MSLLQQLEILEDPRKDINKRHDLLDVVFLVLSGVLSGASGWKSIQDFGDDQLEWLRQHRKFENGIPRRHCIANIIKALDSDLLLQAVMNWLNENRKSQSKTILAIDGKTLRGAWRENFQHALHVVSAFDAENGVSFYQGATNRKGKEAKVVHEMLDVLTLNKTVVTLDALHCQMKTMEKVITAKGDFMIQLKGNRQELKSAVDTVFEACNDISSKNKFLQTTKGHGREEVRKVTQLRADFGKEVLQKWPHIKTIIRVETERTIKGETAKSTRQYVSSLELNPEEAAQIIRKHWAVENNLHWVLDVVFREDSLKVSDPDGAKHLALFNRVALNIIKQHQGFKDSLAAKRRKAAWNQSFRSELLMG